VDAGETRNANASTFTWKNLDYTVKAGGEDLRLLNKVSGYCRAGTLTALVSERAPDIHETDVRWARLVLVKQRSWMSLQHAKTKG